LIFSGVSCRRIGMQIYVGKGGQQLGPFSLEEINRKLADGTFAGSDLAWYEGAAGWAALSSVTGVVVPPGTPALPAAAAAPAPAPTPTPAIPVRSNIPIVESPASPGKPYKTMALIGWILLGVTLVISFIPILGCGSWILVWPVAVAAIILGIMAITRGGTGQGIALIIASIVLVPVALIAPIISTSMLGSADRAKETLIRENLRAIDIAKSQFVLEKNPANGASVTMTNLTSYLSTKEIKPAVGEQYDPMPVGQAPTATLPATKSLGKFKGGEVLTAEVIDKDLENSSVKWFSNKTTTWSFGSSPTPTVTPGVSPKSSVAPSVTASPKPSVSPNPTTSPKSSSAPHSLISPRQSVEPEESPSSRPSPSAKFGPRTGPRRSPSPSEEQSDSEKSGGLKQGRQYPRESPSESPEETPDDN
jgi:uncharacterized protein DUF4339